ncbi:MAG: hypothetical protein HOY79_03650 [Streptomyces sp.]|nr:hypothetical protein [Streptomyces sp.]
MPDRVYAVCHGCGKPHQVVTGDVFRRHRLGMATCPGAGQHPREPVTTRKDPARPAANTRHPAPPDEPADRRSCDGGGCNAPSVGWRWYRDLHEWLPVCGIHMAGPPGPARHYDTQENHGA